MLHTKSGNRCAKCNIVLVENSICIGENAHIYGEKPDSARYDATKPSKFVNSEPNLIFLCCNCHKVVDSDAVLYPVTKLLSMKSAHELRVVQALQQAAIDYTFAELQVITDYLIGVLGKTVINTNYQLLKLPEKIKKNHLDDVEGYIAMGLASVSRVEDYINRHPDPRFAEKLTRIFVNKYISLQAEFNEPVSVFNALWDFACNDQVDYNYRSAGLSTLVYFFEKCDVFEK